MESNVMAGRALLGCMQLPNGQHRYAIFLVLDKTMQGNHKSAAYRAFRRIAPKSIELVLLPHYVARAFCGRLIEQHQQHATYFDPSRDWPQPIVMNAISTYYWISWPSLGIPGAAANC